MKTTPIGWLWSSTPEQRKQKASAELAQALSEDPTNVSAVIARAELSPERSQQLGVARSLVQAKPDDGRAWSFLARALGEAGIGERSEMG